MLATTNRRREQFDLKIHRKLDLRRVPTKNTIHENRANQKIVAHDKARRTKYDIEKNSYILLWNREIQQK